MRKTKGKAMAAETATGAAYGIMSIRAEQTKKVRNSDEVCG